MQYWRVRRSMIGSASPSAGSLALTVSLSFFTAMQRQQSDSTYALFLSHSAVASHCTISSTTAGLLPQALLMRKHMDFGDSHANCCWRKHTLCDTNDI